MDITEFFEANEKTIERDPVRRLNARVEQICKRILPDDLPADVRVTILDSRLTALHARAKALIERGRTHLLDVALDEFTEDLGKALYFERQHGALKVCTPADEVRRISGAGLWSRFHWNGHETGTLLLVLKPGETIKGVGFREIVTSERTIVRYDAIFDAFRPNGYSVEFWRKGCTSENEIAAAEAMERHEAAVRERPFSATSGPNASESTVVRR
jgi:hypothetical protein